MTLFGIEAAEEPIEISGGVHCHTLSPCATGVSAAMVGSCHSRGAS